ncbi:MAG: HEPN domain-containing protein [Actinobacteria bacterium]|nr:MAG: HEPN domain-containing protein [Actinomycetota bacterium]
MREEASLWYEQAQDDLKYAESNLNSGIYYICAFLSQQSAEKALKALYIETKREIPTKTHNLIKLGKELDASEEMLDFLREINPAFITTRYPDAANGKPTEMFDERIAKEHLEKAKEVLKWVQSKIG